MKKIIFLGCLLLSTSAFAKVRTYYSNQEVLVHVLSSEEFATVLGQESRSGLGELQKVEVTRTGSNPNNLKTVFTLRFLFATPGLDQGGRTKTRPCYVTAKVAIEVVELGRPRVTISQLAKPAVSDPVCAQ